jgi:site-specific DNA recombinase
MSSPRLAGWLTHKGAIATHSQTGLFLRGKFPPILTDEEFERLLRATSPDPSGATAGQDEVRRYMLSGLVRCGVCGAKMDGNRRRDRSQKVRHYYACKKGSRLTPDGDPACGQVSCSGIGLDALVAELVLPRLMAASRMASMRPELPHAERLAEIATRRSGLLRQHRDEELSAEAVFPEVSRLEAEAKRLRREQDRWLTAQGVTRLATGITEAMWNSDAYTVAEKRRLITTQIEVLVVAPATRRTGPAFDYERVTPVWWQSDD